jgi:hypothetical protein
LKQGDKMAAPKGNNFNPNGRTPKEINWDLFEQLCEIQCTQSEIASVLKVHVDTLRNKAKAHYEEEDFSTIYKKYTENGKSSLRRHQFLLSKKNAAMAIWLGKQWLGQKDHLPEAQVNEEINKRFIEVMSQLGTLQSARSISDNSNKTA